MKYSYNHREFSDKMVVSVKKFYFEQFSELSKKYEKRTAFFKAREAVMKQFGLSVSQASSVIAVKSKPVAEDVQLAFNF